MATILQTATAKSTGDQFIWQDKPNVMFSAYISNASPTGTTTVEIYGVSHSGQPAARARLLGTLTLNSSSTPTTYADSFVVSNETYEAVFSKVTAIEAGQTVVVVMGD